MLRIGGPASGRIADLWWGLFGISVVVWVVVTFLLVWALVLRRGPNVTPKPGGVKTVVIAGVVVPLLVLIAAFAGSLFVLDKNRNPPDPPVATISVIGHDWWWEVRYPHFTTANEIHIPVGQSVEVNLQTADVIHSFWVPSLTAKTDLIPNKINHTWLLATKPGRYRGQCAEYCGIEHAGMAFLVVAQPRAQYDAWVAHMAEPATTPSDSTAAHGAQVFQSASCASCHTIRGTTADGKVGPDLTHFGSRWSIGAGVAPNNAGWLSGWIANSQTVKPGNLMPPQPLSSQDLQAVTAYLEGQK